MKSLHIIMKKVHNTAASFSWLKLFNPYPASAINNNVILFSLVVNDGDCPVRRCAVGVEFSSADTTAKTSTDYINSPGGADYIPLWVRDPTAIIYP